MICDTGSRISELLGIRLSDLRLDITTPTVTVLGKGNAIRTIPLAKEVIPILKKYIWISCKHPYDVKCLSIFIWNTNMACSLCMEPPHNRISRKILLIHYHRRGWIQEEILCRVFLGDIKKARATHTVLRYFYTEFFRWWYRKTRLFPDVLGITIFSV